MARLVTKNMSKAELKATKKEITASLKALQDSQKMAARTLADAAKARDSAIKAAEKDLAVATKAHAAAVNVAGKAYNGVVKGHAKDSAKLDVQVSAHNAKLEQISAALAAQAEPAEA